MTALHIAAANNDIDFMKVLITAGADIHAINNVLVIDNYSHF